MSRIVEMIPALPMFAFTDGDRWRPGIGDPTFIGWFTVFAYVGAAFLCWKAAANTESRGKVRLFWILLTAALVALGINKQLDLQTELTFIGKDFAKATGWYENRRIVQVIFIALIGIGGIAMTSALFWYFRNELRRLWMALAGIGFLASFIVIRAASFHQVDQFLNSSPGGVRMNWVLELGGIAAIAFPAWRAWKKKNQSSDTSFIWISGGGAHGPERAQRGFRPLRARN